MTRLHPLLLLLILEMSSMSTASMTAAMFTKVPCLTATVPKAIAGSIWGYNVKAQFRCVEACMLTANCQAYTFDNGNCTANINTAMLICPLNGTPTQNTTTVQISVDVIMNAQQSGNVMCPLAYPWAASYGLFCCQQQLKVRNTSISLNCNGANLTSSDPVECCNGPTVKCNNTLRGCTSWNGPEVSWTSWSLCTTTCGTNGTQTRLRITNWINPITNAVTGILTDSNTRSCHMFNCSCQTNSYSTIYPIVTPNTTCTFPMLYKGTYYPACTAAYQTDLGNWCATNTTTTNYNYITGINRWGNCNADCPACLTVDGPVVNASCWFPFTYQKTNYTACTTVNNGYNNGKAWCPTGSNVTTEWGICDDYRLCPIGN